MAAEKQTVEYNLKARENFKKTTRARMSVWEAIEYLNTLIDESDPDVSASSLHLRASETQMLTHIHFSASSPSMLPPFVKLSPTCSLPAVTNSLDPSMSAPPDQRFANWPSVADCRGYTPRWEARMDAGELLRLHSRSVFFSIRSLFLPLVGI